MSQEKIWENMPVFLKGIFILTILGEFHSLSALQAAYYVGYPLFGFLINGSIGVVLFILLVIVSTAILLVGLWKRTLWVWKYGMAYFIFFIVNDLLSINILPKLLESFNQKISISAPGLVQIAYMSAVVGTLVGATLNMVFLVWIYKNKTYFDGSNEKQV